MLSEHNTISQLDYYNSVQSRYPSFLFVPGVEYTTYRGHANGIGSTRYVDHKIGLPNVTIWNAVNDFHRQGALVSMNHEDVEFSIFKNCVGCKWEHTKNVPMNLVGDYYATFLHCVLTNTE
jgi:hypothetical protein